MKEVLKIINAATQMTVNMYTLNHRGTGRSNYLECQAAHESTTGSPVGIQIDFTEMPNCVKDIMFQIDNHTEAFSVTSTAKDVEFLIDRLNAKASEIVLYGAKYGTYWAERLMHLVPKQVRGYILDGVVNEASPTFTTWSANRKFPEKRFIQICENDTFCSSKLAKLIQQHGNLLAAWRALYDTLDAAPLGKNACADLVRNFTAKSFKPSHGLRNYLGNMITHQHTRVVVPAILYRLSLCRV